MTITEPLAVTARREIAGAWLAGFEAAVQAGDTPRRGGHVPGRRLLARHPRPDLGPADVRGPGPDRRRAGRAGGRPARPSGFWLEGTAPDMFERRTQGWTIESFFTFETDIARCRGHIRLLTDPQTGEWKAWTLLTAMEDLKGFEEKAGALRPVSSAPHGVLPPGATGRPAGRLPGAQRAAGASLSAASPAGAASACSGRRSRGAGHRGRPGGPDHRGAAAPAGRERRGHRARGPGRGQLAAPLLLAGAAQPGLGQSPAVPEVPGLLARLPQQGRAGRLAGGVRLDHVAGRVDLHGDHRRPLRRGGGPVDGRAAAGRRRRHRACIPGTWSWPPACSGSRAGWRSPARSTSPAGCCTPPSTPAGSRPQASGPWWSARAAAPTTWPRTCTRRARRSPCCSGPRPAWSAWNPGRPGRTPSTARTARPPRTATWSTTPSRCPCWPSCTRT